MKCLICKYLNTREEARKHLNKQTVLTLGQAHTQLAVPRNELAFKIQHCDIHGITETAVYHLRNAADFSDELKALVRLFPRGVPGSTLQTLLNKYPDPRK